MSSKLLLKEPEFCQFIAPVHPGEETSDSKGEESCDSEDSIQFCL
jgi:hypothetical protein